MEKNLALEAFLLSDAWRIAQQIIRAGVFLHGPRNQREDIEAESRFVVLQAVSRGAHVRCSWSGFVAGVVRNVARCAARRSLATCETELVARDPDPREVPVQPKDWRYVVRGRLERALVESVLEGQSCATFAALRCMQVKEVNRVARRIAAKLNARAKRP